MITEGTGRLGTLFGEGMVLQKITLYFCSM
jgi:hypothetical protein